MRGSARKRSRSQMTTQAVQPGPSHLPRPVSPQELTELFTRPWTYCWKTVPKRRLAPASLLRSPAATTCIFSNQHPQLCPTHDLSAPVTHDATSSWIFWILPLYQMGILQVFCLGCAVSFLSLNRVFQTFNIIIFPWIMPCFWFCYLNSHYKTPKLIILLKLSLFFSNYTNMQCCLILECLFFASE